METGLIRLECLLRKLVVHLIHQFEDRTAELHAPFEWVDDPFGRAKRKVRGSRAGKRQFIPTQPDFCIVRSREAVCVSHVVNVGSGKGCAF